MLPGMELMGCQNLAVPAEVMHHVVRVESAYNPYAIGVVGGRLVRQPKNLPEAVATVHMLESRGYNFSLGLAQVNRYNLDRYGLDSYEKAFETCPNLQAGSRILAECHSRSGDNWGKAFSCYYSGNFVTGFRHGYVQKVYASMGTGQSMAGNSAVQAIAVIDRRQRRVAAANGTASTPVGARLQSVARRVVEETTVPSPLEPPRQVLPAAQALNNQPAMIVQPTISIPAAAAYDEPASARGTEAVATRSTPESNVDQAFVF